MQKRVEEGIGGRIRLNCTTNKGYCMWTQNTVALQIGKSGNLFWTSVSSLRWNKYMPSFTSGVLFVFVFALFLVGWDVKVKWSIIVRIVCKL